ncbi:hypothetical protein ZWY2020_020511 [Hordeum vulgare]|nr:hypothetical protein ZWY2020_020511 [Hordeum vulgare]
MPSPARFAPRHGADRVLHDPTSPRSSPSGNKCVAKLRQPASAPRFAISRRGRPPTTDGPFLRSRDGVDRSKRRRRLHVVVPMAPGGVVATLVADAPVSTRNGVAAAHLLLATAVVALLVCLALADPAGEQAVSAAGVPRGHPHERKLGWSASTPACAWVGVTCDAANSTVIKLRLPGVGLVGPIPPSTIGRLTNLQVLSLRANRVSGAIPDDILRLSALRSVFLQDNAISGAILPGVSGLAALERLVLSHSNLSGPIPFALRGLAALRALRIDGNRLSGKIPSIANPGLNTTGSTAPSRGRSRGSPPTPSSETSSCAAHRCPLQPLLPVPVAGARDGPQQWQATEEEEEGPYAQADDEDIILSDLNGDHEDALHKVDP